MIHAIYLKKLNLKFRPHSLFVTALLLAAYTNYSFVFPYDAAIISGIAALGYYKISSKEAILLLSSIGFLLAHFALIAAVSSSFTVSQEQLRSTGLFILTIVAALGTMKAASKITRDAAFSLFKSIAYLILIGVALEKIGILRPISDAVRSAIYDQSVVYANDARDIANYGSVRPKLFTSEPSYVARFFGLCLAAAMVLRPKNYSIFKITFPLIAFAFILPSAALGGGFVAGLAFLIINKASFTGISLFQRSFIIALAAVGVILGTLNIVHRVGLDGSPIEPSAYIRLVQPVRLMVAALIERPFWGYGIGADSALQGLVSIVQSSPDVPVYFRKEMIIGAVSGNVHAATIWQLGILGAGLLWSFIYSIMKNNTYGHALIPLLYMIVDGLSVGDIHTPVLWGNAMIFLAACHIRYRSEIPLIPQSIPEDVKS